MGEVEVLRGRREWRLRELERWLRGGVGKDEEDGDGQEEDGDAEDAAFGAYGSAGEEWIAGGVRGEETALHEAAAVGDAVEEGLAPVPGGVEADAPPQRAGAPEGDDED